MGIHRNEREHQSSRDRVSQLQQDGVVRLSTLSSSDSLFGEACAAHRLLAAKLPECRREARIEARLTCRTICRDYCNNTAVHGFRYFFEARRSAAERFFWVAAVLLSFASCFYLISKIWMKWNFYPVMVTFSEAPTPVWSVPFPAVTICPSTKTRRDLFDFTLTEHRIQGQVATEEEARKHKILSLVCVADDISEGCAFNESAVQVLREVAPTLKDVVVKCQWNLKRIVDCSKYFQTVVTQLGICFSFNSLGSKELYSPDTVQAMNDESSFESSGWSSDTGYREDEAVKAFYPFRQVGKGSYSGLRVVLRSDDRDLDYICRGSEQGYRVILHTPDQPPDSSQQYMVLPLNKSMHVLAKPALMTTTEGLREYSPERRACFFPSERRLRYYKVYSQENCVFECYTNLTVAKCGCAPFSWPRLPGTLVCGFASRCIFSTYESILNESERSIPPGGPVPAECQCLPSCHSLHYDGVANLNDYPWMKVREALVQDHLGKRRSEDAALERGVSLSQLVVYFDSMQFITSRRSELYGHTEFLANSGGLLGLFTGFSVISLVEILYYVSLRLWCDIKRRAEEKRRRRQQ